MITIQKRGRLGNSMFKNCVASILSKKFNIKVKSYISNEELLVLNSNLYKDGIKSYQNSINVNDKNILDILKKTELDCGLNLIGFFQIKDLVINYKKELLSNFNLQYNNNHSEDLFVHVRLGDCFRLKRAPSIDYYIKAIKNTSFKYGYISSDEPHHEIVQELIKKFNLKLYNKNRAETINFAKDFNNLVLSGGTFSWWIGFLSKANSIFYPKGGPKWHGDIFVFDDWNSIDVK